MAAMATSESTDSPRFISACSKSLIRYIGESLNLEFEIAGKFHPSDFTNLLSRNNHWLLVWVWVWVVDGCVGRKASSGNSFVYFHSRHRVNAGTVTLFVCRWQDNRFGPLKYLSEINESKHSLPSLLLCPSFQSLSYTFHWQVQWCVSITYKHDRWVKTRGWSEVIFGSATGTRNLFHG